MTSHQITLLFLDLALILVLARAAGAVARRVRQPAVIGEILVGILLGPTLFGSTLDRWLFPTALRPPLSALADLGIALFMFIIGLELDHSLLRGMRTTAAGIAAGAMVVPFALAIPLALWMSRSQPPEHRAGFVLFLATAMSITAFPVLARILADRGIIRTALGGVALAGAAICDLVAWTLLAVSIAIATPHGTAPWKIALVPPFVAVAFLVGRRTPRTPATPDAPTPEVPTSGAPRPAAARPGLALVMAAVLGSAAFLEWTGLNFIFGAFLIGTIVPREHTAPIRAAIEQISVMLLMPAFFIIAGLAVDLSHLGISGVATLLLIMAVAVGGKFAGTLATARLLGISGRQSAALGALMNTRGLTELIVLTTGVQLGILDHRTYSMMVVMALLTTIMTGPLLDWLRPLHNLTADVDTASAVGGRA
ncbi:cation:proton antiporter domain-containing protein [Catenulispora rubra]|uniref:cation:proton antiporter domain-containing protein n=1 Tax=Catenulispora rubra TaxID=280293 RepID=UPI0018925C6D|nr:cation:proton antiporter [Catenulispora rubra]